MSRSVHNYSCAAVVPHAREDRVYITRDAVGFGLKAYVEPFRNGTFFADPKLHARCPYELG